MSAKHSDPEYMRNARIIRGRVRALHKRDEPAQCWRCGRAIAPGQPFDVGHRNGATGHSLAELAPEHRHTTPYCEGNRANGGRKGAAITNARAVVPQGSVTRWNL